MSRAVSVRDHFAITGEIPPHPRIGCAVELNMGLSTLGQMPVSAPIRKLEAFQEQAAGPPGKHEEIDLHTVVADVADGDHLRVGIEGTSVHKSAIRGEGPRRTQEHGGTLSQGNSWPDREGRSAPAPNQAQDGDTSTGGRTLSGLIPENRAGPPPQDSACGPWGSSLGRGVGPDLHLHVLRKSGEF